jgi:hypothetical protein
MIAQAHLWHYIVAGILLAMLGALGHVCRAVFNVLPDRLSDKPWMDMMISSGYNLDDRLLGTEYDEAGYYRLDSLKNLRNYVVSMVIGGWGAMLVVPDASGMIAYWIDRAGLWLWDLFLYRLANIHFF